MASSKTRAAARTARTASAVSATPTSRQAGKSGRAAEPEPEPVEAKVEDDLAEAGRERPAGQPLWLQILMFLLAIAGLGISAYETWAHFNGNHLAGCPTGGGSAFNCSAVITSPQSMVFGVIPVAVLGLLFYVFAIAIFSPWAWRLRRPEVGWLRLGSVVVGMGFVMYLIYAEVAQIQQICDYCTGVHIITFLLFCITVVAVALWGVTPAKADETAG